MPGDLLGHGVAEDDDVVAVAGPRVTDCDNAPLAGAESELHVDAAAVVLGAGRHRLVLHGDERVVYDPQVRPSPFGWFEESGDQGREITEDAVHGGQVS
ncbi:hypothetical protein ACWDYJ_14945 [Streptomyces sp. NPDC003042]